MDVIAHGLWGGVLFCRRGRKQFFGGLIVGMAPDLLSFGVFHVTHPRWMLLRLAGEISGPPAFSILPDRFQFALAVHQASSLAVRRMAAPYSLRHPDSCHELFPDTFSMAVSDSVR